MTDIDKERLKYFLDEFAREGDPELQQRFDSVIKQLYVYAYGKNAFKRPRPYSIPGEVFYAGPHLLTDQEEERAATYFEYIQAGLAHTEALRQAVNQLNVSDKLIEAALTKYRKRQADLDEIKESKSRK